MKYIRLGAMIAFAVFGSVGFLTNANAGGTPTNFQFPYEIYLSTTLTNDVGHLNIELDHTYYSSNGTHSDTVRNAQSLYVMFRYSTDLPQQDRCVLDAPLYIHPSGSPTVLGSFGGFWDDRACPYFYSPVYLSFTPDAMDFVRPMALQTAYYVGGNIRNDNDSEAYMDFLCAYGSNWSSNAGSYNYELRPGSNGVLLFVYVNGTQVSSVSAWTYTNWPQLTINLHCHLK